MTRRFHKWKHGVDWSECVRCGCRYRPGPSLKVYHQSDGRITSEAENCAMAPSGAHRLPDGVKRALLSAESIEGLLIVDELHSSTSRYMHKHGLATEHLHNVWLLSESGEAARAELLAAEVEPDPAIEAAEAAARKWF